MTDTTTTGGHDGLTVRVAATINDLPVLARYYTDGREAAAKAQGRPVWVYRNGEYCIYAVEVNDE
jgi:hypothetical protein